MDSLIQTVLKQPPEFTHHICAAEGVCRAMMKLRNEESKAAYMIQLTAVVLCNLSQGLDEGESLDSPNGIRFYVLRSQHLFSCEHSKITPQDLGKLEDLYYAACAKLKDFLHRVNILLENNFKKPEDELFKFQTLPLIDTGPVTLGAFHASLLCYQKLLFGQPLVTLLENAVISASMNTDTGFSTESPDIGERLPTRGQSQDPACLTAVEYAQRIRRGESLDLHQKRLRTPGCRLWKVSRMSSGMIFAQLREKYRSFDLECQSSASDDHLSVSSLCEPHCQAYTSPYNLNERAKRLHVPGRPEMPCICDPECICVPLCASDPTQNCLCEENGLFVRVTEGMNIDDLDVPDLVRWRRQSSDDSLSSGSSTSTSDAAEDQEIPANLFDVDSIFSDQHQMRGDGLMSYNDKHGHGVGDTIDFSGFVGENASQFDNVLAGQHFEATS